MAKKGVEIIIGTVLDATFGPMIMVGLGGITTELFRDVIYRPAPVSAAEAAAMLAELKAAPLLNGFRGAAKADVAGAVAIDRAGIAARARLRVSRFPRSRSIRCWCMPKGRASRSSMRWWCGRRGSTSPARRSREGRRADPLLEEHAGRDGLRCHQGVSRRTPDNAGTRLAHRIASPRPGALRLQTQQREPGIAHLLLDACQDCVRHSLSPRDISHVHALDLGEVGEQGYAAAADRRTAQPCKEEPDMRLKDRVEG